MVSFPRYLKNAVGAQHARFYLKTNGKAMIKNEKLVEFLKRTGNPLDWTVVDRALLILVFNVIFGVVLLIRISTLSEETIAIFNKALFLLSIKIFTAGLIVQVVLLLFGIQLRRRRPNCHFFAHLVAQLLNVGLAFFCYLVGFVTHPAIIFAIAAGVVCLLLFDKTVSVPAIIAFTICFIAFTILENFEIIPYGPLFNTAPYAYGKIDAGYAIGTMVTFLFFYIVILTLIGYIFSLWRKREKEVKIFSKALQNELEKGRKIQREFLPKRIPQISGCEIAAYFQPALQLSGDFYDAFLLPNNHVGLVIADVSDKGVGSALFMALLRSLIRAFSGHAHLYYSVKSHRKDKFVSLVDIANSKNIGVSNALKAVSLTNEYISYEHSEEGMFATLFFGVIDPTTGILSYINAGHEPLIIVGLDGIKKKLNPTGPVLGMMPGSNYKMETTQLEPGHILFGFTDGVTEARSPMDELYTRKRLEKSVMKCKLTSAINFLENIKLHLFDFIEQAPQSDDITMLAVRWG
ncbi:MAG: PP2C family protein-serine/threonine phosphatase [Thermodesulfobacteriota bacterium]